MNINKAIQELKSFQAYGLSYETKELAIQALKEIQKYKELEKRLNGITIEQVIDDFIKQVKKETNDIKEIELKDAVLFAYEKGLFTVEDSESYENYGCTGIYCENHGMCPNGFYCFSDSDEYTNKEDFLFHHTEEEIAEAIAETIQDFINDMAFPEEAGCYLYDIERICEENGRTEYLETVQEWIEKAEKIVEDEMRR